MNRRQFLTALGMTGLGIGLSGFRLWPDEGFWNPCHNEQLPEKLAKHPLVLQAFEGINPSQLWDCHAHLIGIGDNQSGIWINPKLRSIWHPIQNVQFIFYLNASCADIEDNVDHAFVERLKKIMKEFPAGVKLMLLAFDYHHDEKSNRVLEHSPFHTPNAYAEKIAKQYPEYFEWIASIHPYRRDAIEALERAIKNGARAIKWLPPAMGIDPSSKKCDAFYEVMAKHDIPLLSHAGDEHAVDAGDMQRLGNPLLFRRAMDAGVRVILAHCASMGSNVDLDKGANANEVANIDLFARLVDDPQYHGRLFGDVAAITQINRSQEVFEKIYLHQEWHDRLLYGSDYPLPGVMPVFSLQNFVDRNYISQAQAELLSAIRKYNALLFDVLLKRMIRVQGKKLGDAVFDTRRHFENNRGESQSS